MEYARCQKLPVPCELNRFDCGGSINHFSSHIVRHAIDRGLLESHLTQLRITYRARAEAMDDALKEHFDGLAYWQRPGGGYFFWLRIHDSVDTKCTRINRIMNSQPEKNIHRWGVASMPVRQSAP